MSEPPPLSFRGKPLVSLANSRIKWTPSEIESMNDFLSLPIVTAVLRDCSEPLPNAQVYTTLPLVALWEALGWTDILDEVTQDGYTVKAIVMPKVLRKLESLWKKRVQDTKEKVQVKKGNRNTKRQKPTRPLVSSARERKVAVSLRSNLRPRVSIGTSTALDEQIVRGVPMNYSSDSSKGIAASADNAIAGNLEAAIAAMRFLMDTAASKDRDPVRLDLGKGFQYKPHVHVHLPTGNIFPASEATFLAHPVPDLRVQHAELTPRSRITEHAQDLGNGMDREATAVQEVQVVHATNDVLLPKNIPEGPQPIDPKPKPKQATAPETFDQAETKHTRLSSSLRQTQDSEPQILSIPPKTGTSQSLTTTSSGTPRRIIRKETREPLPSLPRRLCKFLLRSVFAILLFGVGSGILLGFYHSSATLPTNYQILIGLLLLIIAFLPLDRIRRKLRTILGKLGYYFMAKALAFTVGLALLGRFIPTNFQPVHGEYRHSSNSTSRARHGQRRTPLEAATGGSGFASTWADWLVPLFCCLILAFAFMTIYRLATAAWHALLRKKRAAWRWAKQQMGMQRTDPLRELLPTDLIDERTKLQEKFLRDRGAQIKAIKDEIDRLKKNLAVSQVCSSFKDSKPTEKRDGSTSQDKGVKETEEHKRWKEQIAAHTATLRISEELFQQVVKAGEERALRDLVKLNEIQRYARVD